MRLGAFSVVDTDPEEPHGRPDRVREVLGLAEALEAAGLSSLWVAEHHFTGGGGGCPSPPILLAACGARTRSLRLGALVSVLPFHRPVDVAEEYALLDRLIEGRLNLGVGSGYLPSEFAGFGVDPAEKRQRFDEALETLRTAWAGARFLASPRASTEVELNVRPVQRPSPPLWVAVQRREAVPFVASRGLGVALIPYATVLNVGELAEVVREYRRALPPGVPGSVVAAVHVYAGEALSAARSAFRSYLAARLRTHSTFYEQKSQAAPAHASPEALERDDLAVFGPPREVAERLSTYARAGVDELLGIFDFGGLAPEEVRRSVGALGAAWSATP